MSAVSDVPGLLDIVLSTPGMNDVVKVDLKISRKNVLLLNHVIERGLAAKDEGKTGLLSSVSAENRGELKAVADLCLDKANLVELNEKIRQLGNSK